MAAKAGVGTPGTVSAPMLMEAISDIEADLGGAAGQRLPILLDLQEMPGAHVSLHAALR